MQFQGRICPETFHLDKIKNGALVIIVDFNMRNIWKTVPDNQNITIEQNVRFLRGLYPEKYHLLIDKVGILQFRSRRRR